jgi:hypothetical protein
MREDRRRALKTGKILLPGGGVIDCTIRDVSATGAKLKLANASPLPEAFELLTVSSNEAVAVERRWQRGAEAGVAFTGPPRQLDPKST